MATIKDVARLARVSTSTVSRAFSGKIYVEPATRKRIFDAAQQLSYTPNHIARTLKEGKSKMIALLVPSFGNDIWPEIALGIEEEARKKDFIVILCNTQESIEVERRYIDRLRSNSVDGFIIAPALDNIEILSVLADARIPTVSVLRGRKGFSDIVYMDNYDMGYRATNYLLHRNHRRILMVVGNTEIELFRQRMEGYRAALRDFGIPQKDSLVLSIGQDPHDAYERVTEVLRTNSDVDAVFTSSDPQAVCVIRAIKDLGYSIPGDISVIGIDNIPISEMLEPPLTTLEQPLLEIGKAAALQLIHRIENRNQSGFVEKCFQSKLYIRQSTR